MDNQQSSGASGVGLSRVGLSDVGSSGADLSAAGPSGVSPSRVGFGFDSHRFSEEAERPLLLGGVRIENSPGLAGHSDADVITHAITDALLGAAGLGDMGEHFPDTDPAWSKADSIEMLKLVDQKIRVAGWCVLNVDCTVVAERPKIAPYRDEMQVRLGAAIQAPVSIKASTAEKMGSIGRSEGIACWAVVLLSGLS